MNSCGMNSAEVRKYLSRSLEGQLSSVSPNDLETIISAVSKLIERNNDAIKRAVETEIDSRVRRGY